MYIGCVIIFSIHNALWMETSVTLWLTKAKNVASSNMVEKLKLKTKDHLQSYKLTWFDKKNEINASKRGLVQFSLAKSSEITWLAMSPPSMLAIVHLEDRGNLIEEPSVMATKMPILIKNGVHIVSGHSKGQKTNFLSRTKFIKEVEVMKTVFFPCKLWEKQATHDFSSWSAVLIEWVFRWGSRRHSSWTTADKGFSTLHQFLFGCFYSKRSSLQDELAGEWSATISWRFGEQGLGSRESMSWCCPYTFSSEEWVVVYVCW